MGAPGIARLGNVLVRVALVFGVDVQRTNQPLFPEVALGLELAVQFREANVGDSDWDSPVQRRGGATDDGASMYRRPQFGGGGWPFFDRPGSLVLGAAHGRRSRQSEREPGRAAA